MTNRGRPRDSVPARDNSESMRRCRLRVQLRALVDDAALVQIKQGDTPVRIVEVGPAEDWASRRGHRRRRTSDTSSTD